MVRALVSQLVYLHLGASEQKLARIRESVLKLMTRGWDQDAGVATSCARPSTRWSSPSSTPRPSSSSSSTRPPGRKTYLVSASPEEIVQPLAEYLGVDGAIASRAVVDLDGRYTGEMAFYAYGPFKAEAIRDLALFEGIDLAASYAYSRLLHRRPHARGGRPPGGREPRPGAGPPGPRPGLGDRGSSPRPVRLRDRVPVPNLPTAAALTGVALAATGAAVLAWRYNSGDAG